MDRWRRPTRGLGPTCGRPPTRGEVPRDLDAAAPVKGMSWTVASGSYRCPTGERVPPPLRVTVGSAPLDDAGNSIRPEVVASCGSDAAKAGSSVLAYLETHRFQHPADLGVNTCKSMTEDAGAAESQSVATEWPHRWRRGLGGRYRKRAGCGSGQICRVSAVSAGSQEGRWDGQDVCVTAVAAHSFVVHCPFPEVQLSGCAVSSVQAVGLPTRPRSHLALGAGPKVQQSRANAT